MDIKLFTASRIPLLLVLLIFLTGCASVPPEQRHPQDPLEPLNRTIFAFNEGVDRAVLKPVAQGYQRLPSPVRTGVGNFFGNFNDVVTMINNTLQGKFHEASSDLARVMFNTSLGLGGVIDVASAMGLPKHREDFGQTLGYWGTPAGPYLMLPFLGPRTLRDAPALVVDRLYFHPELYVFDGHPRTELALTVTEIVHIRAGVLETEGMLAQISADRYVALRQAWLQRREFLVRDGQVEEDAWLDDLDFLDELDALEAME